MMPALLIWNVYDLGMRLRGQCIESDKETSICSLSKSLETHFSDFFSICAFYGLEATALVRQKAWLWYQAKLCPQAWLVYTGLVSFSFMLRAPQIPSTKKVLLARHEIERELRVKVPSLSDAWQQWGENTRTSNSTAMFLVAGQFLHFPSLADQVPRYCMSRCVHFSTWVCYMLVCDSMFFFSGSAIPYKDCLRLEGANSTVVEPGGGFLIEKLLERIVRTRC